MSTSSGGIDVEQDPYRSKLVKVIIGEHPNQREYYVHTQILTQASPFFQKCLEQQHGWREATEQIIKLPEDDATCFGEILRWAYRGDALDIFRSSHHNYGKMCLRAIGTYQLARKFCVEKPSNALMDTIMDFHVENRVALDCLWLVCRGSSVNDPLRKYLQKQLAWELLNNGLGEGQWDKGIQEFLNEGGGDASEVIRFMGQMHQKYSMEEHGEEDFSALDPSGEPECTYHTHFDTPKCSEE